MLRNQRAYQFIYDWTKNRCAAAVEMCIRDRGGDNVSSNYILGTIEDAGAGEKAITTYDNLILELVGIDKTIAADKIDRQFLEETLTAFQNVSFGGTAEEHNQMAKMINDYENELQEYYEIVNTSSKELKLYILSLIHIEMCIRDSMR